MALSGIQWHSMAFCVSIIFNGTQSYPAGYNLTWHSWPAHGPLQGQPTDPDGPLHAATPDCVLNAAHRIHSKYPQGMSIHTMIWEVKEELDNMEVKRDQDFVELFCGKGNLTRELRRGGLSGYGYDIKRNPKDDVGTPTGMLKAGYLCKGLKPRALGT